MALRYLRAARRGGIGRLIDFECICTEESWSSLETFPFSCPKLHLTAAALLGQFKSDLVAF